jgi:hypothetical protein
VRQEAEQNIEMLNFHRKKKAGEKTKSVRE